MTEEWMPKNKEELMTAIEREWSLLQSAIAHLSEEQMTTLDEGGWSPKDNLAHLTEWMKVLIGYHIDHRPSHEVLGLSPQDVDSWDFNVINPLLFEKNCRRSAHDVLEEMRVMYDHVVERLTAMSYEDLMLPRHDADPQKRPLVLWVLGNTVEHFAEHRETIEKNL